MAGEGLFERLIIRKQERRSAEALEQKNNDLLGIKQDPETKKWSWVEGSDGYNKQQANLAVGKAMDFGANQQDTVIKELVEQINGVTTEVNSIKKSTLTKDTQGAFIDFFKSGDASYLQKVYKANPALMQIGEKDGIFNIDSLNDSDGKALQDLGLPPQLNDKVTRDEINKFTIVTVDKDGNRTIRNASEIAAALGVTQGFSKSENDALNNNAGLKKLLAEKVTNFYNPQETEQVISRNTGAGQDSQPQVIQSYSGTAGGQPAQAAVPPQLDASGQIIQEEVMPPQLDASGASTQVEAQEQVATPRYNVNSELLAASGLPPELQSITTDILNVFADLRNAEKGNANNRVDKRDEARDDLTTEYDRKVKIKQNEYDYEFEKQRRDDVQDDITAENASGYANELEIIKNEGKAGEDDKYVSPSSALRDAIDQLFLDNADVTMVDGKRIDYGLLPKNIRDKYDVMMEDYHELIKSSKPSAALFKSFAEFAGQSSNIGASADLTPAETKFINKTINNVKKYFGGTKGARAIAGWYSLSNEARKKIFGAAISGSDEVNWFNQFGDLGQSHFQVMTALGKYVETIFAEYANAANAHNPEVRYRYFDNVLNDVSGFMEKINVAIDKADPTTSGSTAIPGSAAIGDTAIKPTGADNYIDDWTATGNTAIKPTGDDNYIDDWTATGP